MITQEAVLTKKINYLHILLFSLETWYLFIYYKNILESYCTSKNIEILVSPNSNRTWNRILSHHIA
jgi:hypothetical protein